MRSPFEITRVGLRLLGAWLLLWCWWRIWPDFVTMINLIVSADWENVRNFVGYRIRRPFRFVLPATSPGTANGGLNWDLLTWYVRFGLGVYLVFWNVGLARLLWKGVSGSARRCASCGYDRRGLSAGAACPECGVTGGGGAAG